MKQSFLQILFPLLLCFILGFLFIFGQAWISRAAVRWNKKLVGFSTTERNYRKAFVIAGILFLAIGILILFSIIRF